VGEAVRSFGTDSIIVSLDMKDNKLITKAEFDGCQEAMCLLREFEAIGVSQIIVLDLARVGSGEGVNADFLEKAINALEMDVYVGGGVRDVTDLVELKNLGASGVLLATALHSGKISIADLKQVGLI
jgi:phosphoribosylformimino-5-aminoimidazole carboxamide ribotide isomerase